MGLMPLLASMQKMLTSYVPRKNTAAASQTPTPTDKVAPLVQAEESIGGVRTATAPSQADPVTITSFGEKFLSEEAKVKMELQNFKNDLRKEKILEQEERLKMLIAQVLSQNPRSPLSIDEIYGIWEKQKCRRNYRSGFRGNN